MKNGSNGKNGHAEFDYLIVGAGFAGSVLAERMARGAGKRVLLVDKRNHIGGNAYDHHDDAGVLVHKYGPHIFHTNSREVLEYLSRFTEWRHYQHRVLASVDGQLFPLPINLDTVNKYFGLRLTSMEVEDFFASMAEPRDPVRTSEDVVVGKVGRELYNKFFRGYTRKQWGLDPSELEAQVTARVPTRTNRDDRYFTDSYQSMPLRGYTRMFENLLDHENIKVLLNTDYREIKDIIPHREMIFTGPVDEFFDHRFGRLPYRSLEFKHETHEVEYFQSAPVVNYPNDYLFTRITEFKYLTGQKHPKTSVVYEFPQAEGDPYYPIPQPQNAAIYKQYAALAKQTPGVHFAGRLATYRYYNMDQVVAQALTLYNHLAASFGAPTETHEPTRLISMPATNGSHAAHSASVPLEADRISVNGNGSAHLAKPSSNGSAMEHPHLFKSFLAGGFECSTHRLKSNRRLDLIAATRHDKLAAQDYQRLREFGIGTARDGIRWHLIEHSPGEYDFSSALPMLRAARDAGLQVVWDMFHYGWPDDLDVFSAGFVERFAKFVGAFVRLHSQETDAVPFIAPVNEISYFAWAGGHVGVMNPCKRHRGDELKAQLVRAGIAAVEAARAADSRTRIVWTDPVIHVIGAPEEGEHAQHRAEAYRLSQFQAWDMISGRLRPELGGKPEYLDIIGANYYPRNQWMVRKAPPGQRKPPFIPTNSPLFKPLRLILQEVQERYQRPIFLSETGTEGKARPEWFRYICDEVSAAIDAGTKIEGVCWYPILNHPGWNNSRHCHNGLWDYANSKGEREIFAPLAEEFTRQIHRFSSEKKSGGDAQSAAAETLGGVWNGSSHAQTGTVRLQSEA